MDLVSHCRCAAFSVALLATCGAHADESFAVDLPAGVKAVWDFDHAFREKTPTRERVCINGLWRWQSADGQAGEPPIKSWGYFKIPGCWPGITDYMQKDSQTVFAHPSWKDQPLRSVTAAWYEREITVPATWAGRRITLSAEYVNSLAEVFMDGKRVGELRFPGGEVDLSAHCRPGAKHLLTLRVAALPLREVLTSFRDTAIPRQTRTNVARRGLCGDLFLVSTPAATRITDVKIDTSVRKGEITFAAALERLLPAASYMLVAGVSESGQSVGEFRSKPFRAGDLKEGRASFSASLKPEKLWDIHTPQHQYEVTLTLEDADHKAIDTGFSERFGFREFWI